MSVMWRISWTEWGWPIYTPLPVWADAGGAAGLRCLTAWFLTSLKSAALLAALVRLLPSSHYRIVFFFLGGGLLIIKSPQIRGKSAFAWHSQISARSLCVNCSKMQFESLQMPKNIKQHKHLKYENNTTKYNIVIAILSVYCWLIVKFYCISLVIMDIAASGGCQLYLKLLVLFLLIYFWVLTAITELSD